MATQADRTPRNRASVDPTHRESRVPQPVGIRGCWELVIKILIGLVIIAAYLMAWSRLERLGALSWIFLILILLLLLWLIIIQGHLVRLRCELVQPADCKHGDPGILAGRVLERITGTAGGLGFGHYELEVLYAGAPIPGAIVYADSAGNPDTGATQGSFQVSGGTLGFVDIKAAALGAGVGFLTSSTFQVRLRVLGGGGASHTCTVTFQIASSRCVIKKVGAAWVHDSLNTAEPLCSQGPAGGPHTLLPASVGGNVYVRGAANVYGCSLEQISELHLWAIPDPGFAFAQPADGSALPVAPGLPLSDVVFTTADQRSSNPINGLSDEGNILSFAPGWSTRTEEVTADTSISITIVVPDLVEQYWPASPSGQYTLLLAIRDTAGNTFYDVQRVWLDNDGCTAKISSIGGLAACEDLKLSSFVGSTCAVRGVAWDPPIDPGLAQAAPNDNFGGYSVGFQKNGGGGGTIPPATPGVRVPNEWPALVSPDGLLAEWDIVAALDGGASVPPGSPMLARGTRCAYVLSLGVSDTTLVGEGGVHHGATHLYAINIINDLPVP